MAGSYQTPRLEKKFRSGYLIRGKLSYEGLIDPVIFFYSIWPTATLARTSNQWRI